MKSQQPGRPGSQRNAPRHKIGAAAARAGVGVQTLHYYEREGLIDPPARTASGYRLYSREMVQRVRAIKRAQSLGFTLQEIRELIGIAQDKRPLSEVADVARQRIADIDARIEELEVIRSALRTAMEQCHCSGDLSRCDVLAGLSPDTPDSEDRFETEAGGTP
jgi:MerR family copper efflux transcriptional regulator